jgi:hypothetical protein
MSWLFSQALVVEYSAGCSSDGEQFAPSSSTNTPAMFLSQGKTTEALILSQFGMTCELLTESLGAALLMSFLVDSRAKTFRAQEMVQESEEKEADCGQKCGESLAKYDRDSYSWRTAQCSLFEVLGSCLETWPRWGIMQNGAVYPLNTLEPVMGEIGFGFLPTICKSDGSQSNKSYRRNTQTWEKTSSLTAYLLGVMFNLSGDAPRPKGKFLINPNFAEWMMGWPDGWTDLKELEMDKFLLWQEKHGTSCAKKLGRKKNNMVVCKTSYNSAMLQGLKPHAGGTGTSA